MALEKFRLTLERDYLFWCCSYYTELCELLQKQNPVSMSVMPFRHYKS